MGKKTPSDQSGDPVLDVVSRLEEAARCDTAYRDLYLGRARDLLAPILSEEQYTGAARARAEIEDLLRLARDSITRQDWERAQELSGRAAELQSSLGEREAAIAVAHLVYGASSVSLDPFSPGLQGFPQTEKNPAALQRDVLAGLGRLEKADPSHAAFYAARRAAVTGFTGLAPSPTDASPAATGPNLEQQALSAAERGEAVRLQQLVADVLKARGRQPQTPAPGATSGAAPKGRLSSPPILAEPFPEPSLRPAGELGLEQVEIRPVSETTAAALAEFLGRYARTASLEETSAARDGVTPLRTALAESGLPPGLTDTISEMVSFFAWQVFVSSAGVRYVPMPTAREFVLVEAFPEGEEPQSGLVEALGFSQRRSLARLDIESALLRHGNRLLRERLGLDPASFRIVCIPPDVYVRVGNTRGWGQRPEWTHFDGYRVLKRGQLLALVGGNARYGGLADLCGISATDERETVIARFAVVRRERLVARLS